MNQKTTGLLMIFLALVLSISLGFVKTSLDTQQDLICQDFHAIQGNQGKSCIIHQDNSSWLILVAFGVAFVALSAGAYLAFFDKPQATSSQMVSLIETADKRREFNPIDESKLDAHEKKAVELLRKNNGSMYQSDLIKETGFTKVKTTRLLDKLALKGIIDRKRRGMTNIIVLK